MHLANEAPGQAPNQGSATANNHLSEYAITAELLAERTLDGLLSEHPGELIRTGETTFVHLLGTGYRCKLKEFLFFYRNQPD